MFAVPLVLVVLAILGLSGTAVLYRARLGLDPLEIVAYGVPFGWAGWSLILLGIASLAGELTTLMVLALTFTAGAAGFALWASMPPPATRPALEGSPQVSLRKSIEPVSEKPASRPAGSVGIVASPAPTADAFTSFASRLPSREHLWWLARERMSWLPTIVFTAIAVHWAVFWSRAVQYDNGIFLGAIHFYGDWMMHLGDVASIVYGNNLPMDNPRYVGDVYPYHYLSSFTAAALVKLGLLPGQALALHSYLGMFWLALAIYAFARRLMRSHGALLATVIFLFGGSLGWLLTAQTINETGDFWGTLKTAAWGFGEYDKDGLFAWNQVLSYPLLAQRAWLYGMSLLLFVLILLYMGLKRRDVRPFIFAAFATALLPFANLASLVALALILPFMALLYPIGPLSAKPTALLRAYPVKQWMIYVLMSAALVAPQLLVQQSSSAGAIKSLRWLPGWNLSGGPEGVQEAWWWYWLKNLGFLVLLIPCGLLLRRALPERPRRMVWAMMPTFVIANLVVFQPLPGDNAKQLVVWYVGGAIAAAAAVHYMWRQARHPAFRVLLSLVLVTVILSGLLIHVRLLTPENRWQIASAEEEELGVAVRDRTAPDALFATGEYVSHPVLMVGGRPLMLGWGGQLWTQGYDTRQHGADLRTILQFGPDAEPLIEQYGVDYVAISQREIDDYQANPSAYAARYPVALTGAGYTIFAVSPDAISLALANGATLPPEGASAPPSLASPSLATPSVGESAAASAPGSSQSDVPDREERPPRERT